MLEYLGQKPTECCAPQKAVEVLTPFFCYCLVSKLHLTFCDPMDYSPPGSSVYRIPQSRILEWVAIFSSRESS